MVKLKDQDIFYSFILSCEESSTLLFWYVHLQATMDNLAIFFRSYVWLKHADIVG